MFFLVLQLYYNTRKRYAESRALTEYKEPNTYFSVDTARVYVKGGKEQPLEVEVYNQGMFKMELRNQCKETGAHSYGEACTNLLMALRSFFLSFATRSIIKNKYSKMVIIAGQMPNPICYAY